MAATVKQKQSLYFPDEMLREIMSEAIRLDRSISWTVQQAWRVARAEVQSFPSVERGGEARREPSISLVRQERADPTPQGDEADRRHPSAQVREFLRGKFDHDVTS